MLFRLVLYPDAPGLLYQLTPTKKRTILGPPSLSTTTYRPTIRLVRLVRLVGLLLAEGEEVEGLARLVYLRAAGQLRRRLVSVAALHRRLVI